VPAMQVRTIQIIEDDPFIRLIAQTALAATWTVIGAEDGEAGLAQARSARPDLILLDVRMPRLDGPATLAKLKADPLTASIPVIFLTASLQTTEIGDYRKLPVIGILEKPFDPLILASDIQRMVADL